MKDLKMTKIYKYTGKTIKLSLEEKGEIILLNNNNTKILEITEITEEQGEMWDEEFIKKEKITKILSNEEVSFLSKSILNMFNIKFVGPIQTSLNNIIISKINKNHMILSIIHLEHDFFDEEVKRYFTKTINIQFILPRNEAKRLAKTLSI